MRKEQACLYSTSHKKVIKYLLSGSFTVHSWFAFGALLVHLRFALGTLESAVRCSLIHFRVVWSAYFLVMCACAVSYAISFRACG